MALQRRLHAGVGSLRFHGRRRVEHESRTIVATGLWPVLCLHQRRRVAGLWLQQLRLRNAFWSWE